MSLDSFREQTEKEGGNTTKPEQTENTQQQEEQNIDNYDWHISRQGYWDNVDERFYGENTPNEPPLMNVPEKLAADMEYLDKPDEATEVAHLLDFNSPERYEAVIKVTFNDFSTWCWPILQGGRELTHEVEHFIDRFMPEIVQWRAIVAGEDPDEALEEWNDEDAGKDFSWVEEADNTQLDEEDRKYLNEHADWLEHQNRVVDTPKDAPDIDVDTGDDWTDDW